MANKNPSPSTRFQPGNPGGRGARPKQARDRISTAFLCAFADDFEKHGASAIARMRDEDVASYVKVAAALQPKEVQHRHMLEGIEDAELASVIDELRAIVAARADSKPGAVH